MTGIKTVVSCYGTWFQYLTFENCDKLGDVDQYRKFHTNMIRLRIRIPSAVPQSTSGFKVAGELDKFKQISNNYWREMWGGLRITAIYGIIVMGREENLDKKIHWGSWKKENKHSYSYSYTWARAWFEIQQIFSLIVTRRQNTGRFQRERMSANVLLTQSMSLELGAGEPWPQDAALFQPFEVPVPSNWN